MEELKVGSIIQSSYWQEPVEVIRYETKGELINIIGKTIKTKKFIDQLIPADQISILKPEFYFTEEPWKVFLALEAIRYRYASLYDPLLAMNTSKIDPLPHQIEAVYGYVLRLPKIRFLIADDPGAGKTIMAGLIIKELKLRNLIKKILIVCPGHLKDQWRRELAEKFEEYFTIVDRNLIDANYGINVWDKEDQIITSMDFVKQDDILAMIDPIFFDLVIVDEAHKMSAYKYGIKTHKTGRYKLGETLSKNSNHLLFLTATPHKGDPENFRLFLDLLDKGFFANKEMIEESIRNKDNPLFIRRIKEDLRDFDGKPLFLPRRVTTLKFNLGRSSPNEKTLYNDLSKYVINQYEKASKDKSKSNQNIAFALVILQRRFASSVYALFKSLERRKKRLEELLNDNLENKLNTEFDFDAFEDEEEQNRWKIEEEWEKISLAENKEALIEEINTLNDLMSKAKQILDNEEEIKIKELKKALEDLSKMPEEKSKKKILIFTESKDTLDYLHNKISKWGYKVNCIHGGMKLEERIKAEKIFKQETNVLVATEAAGEGINLQFCNLMINYDIPWNPNRLEQRMGRIHRYGQDKEVLIFNLVAEDTREGKVLLRLLEKLDEIRNILGTDKVFDVIGDVFPNIELSKLLVEVAAGVRDANDILSQIEIKIDENYINQVKEALGESLATRFIDYTRIKEMAEKAKEYRLIPEYTESFFKKAFTKAGGKFRETKDGFIAIDSIPPVLKRIASQEKIKRKYGEILKSYSKITFDKEIARRNQDAEFVTFGHPLFETVIEYVEENFRNTIYNGAVFYDPDGKMNGYILFYEGEVQMGYNETVGKRLFAFYIDENQNVKQVPPSILWDLSETESIEYATLSEPHNPLVSDEKIQALKNLAEEKCIDALKNYQNELLLERKRQIQIKEKYGVESLNHQILTLDAELIELYERKRNGENVDLAIRNKENYKSALEETLEKLKENLRLEKQLVIGNPEFLGMIKVLKGKSDIMVSDEEVEKIGMEYVMKYEKENGRDPQDVSSENLGFDIRSIDKSGAVRYIEVKTRSGERAVALTQNEWFKAKRFQDDYYLYVVLNAVSSPELYIFQNPAKNLNPEEKIETVRYIIDLDKIKSISDKI